MTDIEISTDVIIDSELTFDQAISGPFELLPAQEVLDAQELIDVYYFSFDNTLHKGQMVVNKEVSGDIGDLFDLIQDIKFPIKSVIPIGDLRFLNDDDKSAYANNSSGFCYRRIAKTDRLSNHSFGRAIDLNPYQNPYIRDDYHQPEGIIYNPNIPGSITSDGLIVKFLKSRGWDWGGDWTDRKDYMHFEKPQI